jgi:stringent starvation protein B
MKIVITSKKPVLTQFGRHPNGVMIDVPDQLAKFLIERGDAVRFETKEAMERPLQAAGEMEQSSALPVAQASQEQMSSESDSGEAPKKRGRPKKA